MGFLYRFYGFIFFYQCVCISVTLVDLQLQPLGRLRIPLVCLPLEDFHYLQKQRLSFHKSVVFSSFYERLTSMEKLKVNALTYRNKKNRLFTIIFLITLFFYFYFPGGGSFDNLSDGQFLIKYAKRNCTVVIKIMICMVHCTYIYNTFKRTSFRIYMA